MATINVYDAKTNLSRLLDAVERGERVTIARHGRPIADLVPHRHRTPLRFGGLIGEIVVDDDEFVAADTDIAEMFGLDE